jgi:drug/metabolite transporter (DMT)-like permease
MPAVRLGERMVPFVELSATMFLSASHVVLAKIVLRSFPLFFASGATMGLTAVVYLAAMTLKGWKLPRLAARDVLLLVLQAFGGLFLYRILILYGLQRTGAIEAGIVLSSTPAVVGLLAFVFLRERLTWRTIAAIGLCSLGILVLNLTGAGVPTGGRSGVLVGSLLLFLAVIGDALYTVFRKVLSGRISPLANSTIISTLCFAMFLPLILADLPKVDFPGITAGSWLILLYYGTVVPSLSFLLWFRGVSKVRASTADIFSSLLPIFTLLLSLLILHERLTWTRVLGMVMIIAGILLSTLGTAAQRRAS